MLTQLLHRLQDSFYWTVNVKRFRWVLLADAFIFSSTAIGDMIICGREQVVTAILRIAAAVINSFAFIQVQRELASWSNVGNQNPDLNAWQFPSIVAGQATAVPMLLIPFWIEFSGDFHDVADILVIIIASLMLLLAFIAALGALFSKSGSLTVSWGVVIALLPLAGLIQFWYMTFYRPVHERPRVNVVAKIDEFRRYGKVTHAQGAVTVNNVGSGELDVLGAFYTVTAYDNGSTGHMMTSDQVRDALTRSRVAWREESGYKGVLKVGRLVRHGGHLTPGQKLLTSFSFDVDNRLQEKLRLTVFLSLITHGGEDLGEFRKCEPEDAEETYVCFQSKLPRESIIRGWLGDSPEARVSLRKPTDETPVPHLETDFLAVTWPSKKKHEETAVQSIDLYRRSRAVTSSVEYRLDP
ncbi:hypothetical protein ACFV20_35895 [Streptomyces sp. NPDC059696]|uniref:hypothetical protein n=1 Tax=Streptomyces sp. NPDC059696 TaxID=3346911 RepID=UPI0036CFEBED